METQTIFLDEQDAQKGKRQDGKLFWVVQFALCIWIAALAVTVHSDPQRNVLRVIALVCVCLMVAILVFLRFFVSPTRRPFITFQDDRLVVKQSLFRKAQQIARDEISSVDLQPSAIEIIPKDAERGKIRLEMMSYAVNQKVKACFHTYMEDGENRG